MLGAAVFPLLFSLIFGTVKPEEAVLVLVKGNSSIVGENSVFEMLFFEANNFGSAWYLGIRYATIAAPTYVWVANRDLPVRNSAAAVVEISGGDGRLQIVDSDGAVVWKSDNTEKAAQAKLMSDGNLVLSSDHGGVVWQSFDSPTDTLLPGMNVTPSRWLTSWKNSTDPSLGKYSLRLQPPEFGELELVYDLQRSYWSSGRWIQDSGSFSEVPEMTMRYIHSFWFVSSSTPNKAALGYSVTPPSSLSRLVVDPLGTLRQYTWSAQSESWEMFWFRPINQCRVYALCGKLGLCSSSDDPPCTCPSGLVPVEEEDDDYSGGGGGCGRGEGGGGCEKDDEMEEIGAVRYDGGTEETSLSSGLELCQKSCLNNCSCVGMRHDSRTNTCTNLYGTLLNLQNQTSATTMDHIHIPPLFLRVPRRKKMKGKKPIILIAAITTTAATVIVLCILAVAAVVFKIKRREKEEEEEERWKFKTRNMKVFTYKELEEATGGFSSRLGHGGFGAVFKGELSDSTVVAVKRLGRPGAGEREFRAEVRTIGNIHHINVVRLLGFCCEGVSRLLVYEYMEKGSLSQYLAGEDGGGGRKRLRWEERLRVAVGTAKGLYYLHEGCRESIIHCDIKPENILLDGGMTAKVSDFGLAKVMGREFSRVPATMRGTWGYVAPEWISGVTITAKADVYSYGMTLLEIIAGRRNMAAAAAEEEEGWWSAAWAAGEIVRGKAVVEGGGEEEEEAEREEAERAGRVAVWCVQDEEDCRPSMGMVVKMLEGLVPVDVPPPPRLLQTLLSDHSSHRAAGSSTSPGEGAAPAD